MLVAPSYSRALCRSSSSRSLVQCKCTQTTTLAQLRSRCIYLYVAPVLCRRPKYKCRLGGGGLGDHSEGNEEPSHPKAAFRIESQGSSRQKYMGLFVLA